MLDTDECHAQELNQEIQMNRISNILDKIINTLLKDISFRKRNKKVTYPTPKLNPRSTTLTSMDQLHEMKTALEDEMKGIIQITFVPEAEMEDRITLIAGEDIPDDTGRPRDDRRRQKSNGHNQHRATQPTVNFDDRKQHRRTTMNEVQQTLLNISTNNDQVNNTNARPDHHETQQ